MAAIRGQRLSGTGCYIDMSQCETGLMLSGTSIIENQITGKPTSRYGNRMPFLDWSPHGAYRCVGDDNWIAISIQSDEQWRPLVEQIGSPEWALDGLFASAAGAAAVAHRASHDAVPRGQAPARRRDPRQRGLRGHGGGVLEEHMNGRQFVVGDAVTVADFVLAYTLDWASEAHVLDGFPHLQAYMTRMYARPHAPLRIAEALASINA